MVNTYLNDDQSVMVETIYGKTYAIWQRRGTGPENDVVVLTQEEIFKLANEAGLAETILRIIRESSERSARNATLVADGPDRNYQFARQNEADYLFGQIQALLRGQKGV